MKDAITIWSRFLGRRYSSVNTNNNFEDSVYNETTRRRSSRRLSLKKTINRNYKSYFAIALLGFLFLFTGFLILIINPYDTLFKMKILFVEGGEIFEMWRKPPVEIYLRVYLFNVTNKDAFLSGKEKLRVNEVGPYVYREIMSHENVTFNDNGTVTATPYHPLMWVPELSVGHHERDRLVLPHIALLSIADVVSDSSYFTRLGMNLLIRQTKTEPLVEMSPKEFMFGYPSTLMTLGNKFLPKWISFEKLGLIDRMYDFQGDYETVYTGKDDYTKAGLLDTYNGSPKMPQWEGKCGTVRGASDGTKFRSPVNQEESLLFFRKSMCRPQMLVPMPQNTTKSSGLEGFVYKFPKNSLDNGHIDPENACFCKTKTCLRRGLLDVRQCYYGFPIALSYPHFIDSDPTIAKDVDGYEPDRQKHETYFVIQPQSGLPLDLAVRFQINMALGKIGSIAHVSRFEDMVLPLLWTEIRLYSLPDYLAARFQLYLNILPLVSDSGMIILLLFGTILLALAFYKYTQRNKTKSHPVSWLDEEVETVGMNKKLTRSYKNGEKDRLSSKELEVYFNSLVTPLNQDLDIECHELDYQQFHDLNEHES